MKCSFAAFHDLSINHIHSLFPLFIALTYQEQMSSKAAHLFLISECPPEKASPKVLELCGIHLLFKKKDSHCCCLWQQQCECHHHLFLFVCLLLLHLYCVPSCLLNHLPFQQKLVEMSKFSFCSGIFLLHLIKSLTKY